MRRAKALENILNNLTVTIRDDELVVGTLTKAVRSCQLFPENSYKWVMDEFDTMKPEWLTHLRFLKKIRLL